MPKVRTRIRDFSFLPGAIGGKAPHGRRRLTKYYESCKIVPRLPVCLHMLLAKCLLNHNRRLHGAKKARHSLAGLKRRKEESVLSVHPRSREIEGLPKQASQLQLIILSSKPRP